MRGFISFCVRKAIRNKSDKENRGFHVSFLNWRKAICFIWNRFSVYLNSPKSLRMEGFISFCEREVIRNKSDKVIRGFHVSFVNWRKAICFVWNRFSGSLNSPKSLRMEGFISFCEREAIRNKSDKENRGFQVPFVNWRKAICFF